jgi:hypothetical protein
MSQRAWLLAGYLSASGCGYHAAHGGEASGRLHVGLARSLVADAVAANEVVSGVREALAREGALAGGEGWPRVEVEVLRTGEASEGIVVGGTALAPAPQARGIAVSIAARAWIAASPDAPPERDTGDVTSEDVIAVDAAGGTLDLRSAAFHRADAVRAAARRLGERLGQRVIGLPTAGAGEDGDGLGTGGVRGGPR